MLTSKITLNCIKEYTIECNPLNINNDFINLVKNIKNLRISFGIQSFNKKTLTICNRLNQDNKIIINSLEKLSYNQINTSIDLINGLPDLNISLEINNLKKILKKYKNINHISFYELSIEKNSKFFKLKNIKYPPENKICEYEKRFQNFLNEHNFKRYEISNYAKNNHYSFHNLNYWKYKNYIGLGPSAHSTVNGIRMENFSDINTYLTENYKKTYELTKKEQIEEFLLMGLRLTEGIKIDDFNSKFSISFNDIFKNTIEFYKSENMLEIDSNYVKILNNGLNILNKILIDFFKELDLRI